MECPHCSQPLLFEERFTSPVPNLLETNGLPTESQSLLIRTTVTKAREEIRRLNAEIRRMKLLLKQIAVKREELTSYAIKHEALMTPIRRMPSELLLEIFSFCIPKTFKHSSALLLTHVSQRWRNVMLSTPQLWSSIRVGYWQHPGHAVEMLKAWMERSGCCPLTLFIDHPEENITALLEVITPHSERWKSINFHMSYSMHAALASVRGRLSSLTHLQLSTPKSRPGMVPTDIYELAPNLRTVKIMNHIETVRINLPWSQVTKWTGGKSAWDCLSVLWCAENLVAATFVPLTRRLQALPTNPCPPHLCLSSLDFQYDKEGHILELLPLLTLPALHSLSISRTSNHAPCGIELLADFLDRSPHLKTLKLHGYIPIVLFKSSLFHAPSVETLEVDANRGTSSCIDDVLMECLTYDTKEGPCLLPQLRSLQLKGGINVSERFLIRMVLSRLLHESHPLGATTISRLQVIKLECLGTTRISPRTVASLRYLEKLGLSASIQRHSKEMEVVDSMDDHARQRWLAQLSSPLSSRK